MSNSTMRDSKTFETKVANLIAATRHLAVPHILSLRRMTLTDPETRKWASEKQLNVVFNVILTKAIERTGLDVLKTARDRGFAPLLPNDSPQARDGDIRLLADLANQLIGPPPMTEAESAQAGFEALLARGPSEPPPKLPRSMNQPKEPPPLFAAQLGPAKDRVGPMMPPPKPTPQLSQHPEDSITEGSGDERPYTDFPTLFDDTLCSYCGKVLSLLQITGPSQGRKLPFMVSPAFSMVYQDVMRRYMLPQMRSSRQLQALATGYNWAEVGGERLIQILQGGEVNNPILHNWDTRWNAFRTPKGKKLKPSDNPWPLFQEEATKSNFVSPAEEHLPLLADLIRFEADAFAKCWRELCQLYEQEFSPYGRQEQAREGAFRDGLMKWASKMPDHVGEFFAIRAYFDLEKIDGQFMRRLINNFGRNDAERRRNAPYLSDFVQNLHD